MVFWRFPAFNYFGKYLIVSSGTTGRVSIISFVNVIGAPADIARISFTLVFSLITGILKWVSEKTRNKQEKHNKTVVLAKIKLNSIETLISQELVDLEIIPQEFKTSGNEKEKNEKLKENIEWRKVVMN